MKNLNILITCILITLIGFACSSDPLYSPPNNNELLEGAVFYEGSYPTPGNITYIENGITYTVSGFPGQIIIYFKPSFKEEDATSLINTNNGTILGKIPKIGYYFAAVTAGTEAGFISALDSNQNTQCIKPNISPGYMSDTVLISDLCSGNHGIQVMSTYMLYGGGSARCEADDDGNGHPVTYKTTANILTEVILNQGANTYINVSSAGPDEKTWEDTMVLYLEGLVTMPSNLTENLVITFAAGNNNLNLTNALSNIRNDPRYADLLRRNVLIVGATDSVYHNSNDAPGDTDFICMDSVVSPNMSIGTSFAAPRALALIQILVEQFSISPTEALFIAKRSASANINHELIREEAITLTTYWIAAKQHDPPEAYNVSSIAFTLVGTTTSAVITPVYSNVTVSYTVSGTDNYYDSGIRYTNSTGSVSFNIPPGAPGVVDYITVTAILSGKMKSTYWTWDSALKLPRIKK